MSSLSPAAAPTTLLEPVMGIAIAAGRRIMEVYAEGYEIVAKTDHTPVTAADLAANDVIVAALGALTPELPILSEESGPVPYRERRQWSRYWLVDPLDGTREFIKGNGEFSVNIALIVDHQPVLGVVYAPALGTVYHACRGHGAYKREATGAPEPITTRNNCHPRIVVAASRSHRGASLERFLRNLGEYDVITMGSALKCCLVAEGKADVYPRLGPTSEWDTAAAQVVLEEAGGRLTTLEMQPLRYNTKESLLNPHFFACGCHQRDWSAYLSAT